MVDIKRLYPSKHIGLHRGPFVVTGEKRPPRQGEWYLDLGEVRRAKCAKHDMTTPCDLARPATPEEIGDRRIGGQKRR